MKCDKCGIKIKKNYKLCPNCGKEVIIEPKKKIKDNWNKKNIFLIVGVIIVLIIGGIFFLNKGESIKTIRKSVVKINVYDKSGEVIQTGSGFIVFDKNILVTNAHVITGGNSADAISENDEKLFVDGAIYYNQDGDIAILKLNNQNNIKPLKISTKYNVGDKVIAIGSPLGIKNSVSDGMISNILEDKTIQHSAPISSGSSGGTLFNSKGKVIGMNTATIVDGQNINLSIPIEKIKEAYQKSKNNKVKSIKKIQFLDDKVKSVMLNNNAGKELVELLNELNKTDTDIYYEDTSNYKKTYVEGYYIYKLADNNIISDWLNVGIDNTFDDNGKFIESKLPMLKIFKLNDTSSETISVIKGFIADEISGSYNELLRLPEYSELRTNCDFEKETNCVINLETNSLTAKLSNNYVNAFGSPKISHYNNYVYAIVSKDTEVVKQIEKIIKKLP